MLCLLFAFELLVRFFSVIESAEVATPNAGDALRHADAVSASHSLISRAHGNEACLFHFLFDTRELLQIGLLTVQQCQRELA